MWRLFNAFVRGARGARCLQYCKEDDINSCQAKVQLQLPNIDDKALYSNCPPFREQLHQSEWTPGTAWFQYNLVWGNRRSVELTTNKARALGSSLNAYLHCTQSSSSRQCGHQSCKRQEQIQFLLKHSILQALGWGSAIALTWSLFQPLNYRESPKGCLGTNWEYQEDVDRMRNLPKVDNSLSLQNAVYSHISIEKDTSLFSLLYDIVLNQPIQCNASKLAKERTSPDELQEEHLEAVKELFEESRSNDSGCPSEDKMLVTEVIAEKVSEKEEVIIEECSENEERKSEYERLELETNAAIEEFKDSLQELLDSGSLDVSALQNQVMGVVESDIGRNIVEEEPEVAFHYFKNGALLGDPSSTFNLGLCYHLGKGTKQNLAKARELYEAAARVNHGWATYNLAVLMGKGEGGSQDQVYARALLQKAAHLGVGEAKDALRKLKEEEETLSVIHQTQSAPVFLEHSEEHRHSSYSMSDLLFLSSEETDEQFAHGSELIQKDESTDIKFYLPS